MADGVAIDYSGADERQVAAELSGIRRDHVARYEWAAARLHAGDRVLDMACGCGYGAAILADAGCVVEAADRAPLAIEYARKHWTREGIVWRIRDCADGPPPGRFDAATVFETIEHLEHPEGFLRAIDAPRLLCSVPNEEVFPHQGRVRHHHRHYRPAELDALLREAGWEPVSWFTQAGPESEVEIGKHGRTLIVEARKATGVRRLDRPAPGHVTILGLGPSLEMYSDITKRLGGRHAFCDEVWAVNALGDVYGCDLIWHMDDVRVQERRAEALPESNIARMLDWIRAHPGPIMTSQAVEGYPGLVEFPLRDVLDDLGAVYFNSTVAYAVAYAIHIGVREISLFGVDYTYPNAHQAERGRACVEYWLGRAVERGIKVHLPSSTALFDTIDAPNGSLYGYDAVAVELGKDETGVTVRFEPRDLPTAAEIEARYDHSKHPNSTVK